MAEAEVGDPSALGGLLHKPSVVMLVEQKSSH